MVFPWQKRDVPPELAARIPPGQVLTEKFPVLHFGRVPDYGDLSGWDFRVSGEVGRALHIALGGVPRRCRSPRRRWTSIA